MKKPIQAHFVSCTIQAAQLMLTPVYLQRAQETHEAWMVQINAEEAQLQTRLNTIREQKRRLTKDLLLVKKAMRNKDIAQKTPNKQ